MEVIVMNSIISDNGHIVNEVRIIIYRLIVVCGVVVDGFKRRWWIPRRWVVCNVCAVLG